jgi:hypothetical protein
MKNHPGPIGVVYLARCAEGTDTFKRFAASYRKYPAGISHELIVLYKGFVQQHQLQEARQVFQDIPHVSIQLDDIGFDIGSYLEASRRVSHRYLMFVNSYTEFAAGGWLKYLVSHAVRDGVGMAGAMGSYESLFESFGLIQSVIWMCNYFYVPYDEAVHRYCDFVVDKYCVGWRKLPRTKSEFLLGEGRSGFNLLKRGASILASRALWWKLTRRGQVFSDFAQFLPFPNPHIRSNGFMVQRERLLSFLPAQIQKKLDACAFESGADGLTMRVRKAGLSAIIVDNNGRGYDVEYWPTGQLFRVGNQAGLLLTDNQSRAFENMSVGARVTHTRMTWGDYLGVSPNDFPRLAFRFRKGSLSATRNLWREQLVRSVLSL